jgi:hypothetical protein
MLPYDKLWLEHEMYRVEASIKNDKLKKKDTTIMFQWLFCLLLLFVSFASAQDVFFTCPYCRCVIEAEIKDYSHDDYNMKVKSGTWVCPKKGCGYENDNRIRYCGMCGTERK